MKGNIWSGSFFWALLLSVSPPLLFPLLPELTFFVWWTWGVVPTCRKSSAFHFTWCILCFLTPSFSFWIILAIDIFSAYLLTPCWYFLILFLKSLFSLKSFHSLDLTHQTNVDNFFPSSLPGGILKNCILTPVNHIGFLYVLLRF